MITNREPIDFNHKSKKEKKILLSQNIAIMKRILLISTVMAVMAACSNKEGKDAPVAPSNEQETAAGQSAVQDDQSQKDVVKVAAGSKDHTTLVAAVKAAEYVDVLSNAGPFTVFAPTNAAFEKLPAGTVDGLLKPEKKADLRNILEYHVTTSALKEEYLKDGMSIGMVNGGTVKISKGADGKIKVNDANVLAAVPASNGMVYVIDAVLLPSAK